MPKLNAVNSNYTTIIIVVNSFLCMPKAKGGKGHSAPYETTHVRVPIPVKPEVEAIIARFHDPDLKPVNTLQVSRDEAVAIAEGILISKKSARISLSKLLTALYGTQISL